jgi:alpha-L-rhamnosidase
MKRNPFFVYLSALPLAWRRLWRAGGSCLWFGALSLPMSIQALADSSSDQASSQPDQVDAPALDWTAQWIGRSNPASVPALGQQAQAPELRKEFTLSGSVASARLRISGLGFYEAYVNGRRVGDQVLDPPPTTYSETALYATFDVSQFVHPGANAIGVTLGRGYFSGVAQEGFGLGFAQWRNEPRLLLQLDVTYKDGQTTRVITDGTWQMTDSPIQDSLSFGEHYDARLEQSGWTVPGFDASAWTPASVQPSPTKKVLPRAMPPIKIFETLAPVAVSTPQPGVSVYDFGRTTAGWERIFTRGMRGTTITLILGETLNPDGTVFQHNAETPSAQVHLDTYTLSGLGDETWEPRFMRHGFRFVQVSYSPTAPTAFRIKARVNHTAVPPSGSFLSSNTVLNRIHENQRTTVLNNLWGFPTDTPWRDRQGWTADAWLYMTSAAENFGMKSFYEQWFRTYRESGKSDGSLPIIAPQAAIVPLYNDPSWSGTLIFDVWQHYLYYGDIRVLSDNYDALTRWMDLMATTIATTGNVFTGFSFGDWASPGSENNPGGADLYAPEGSGVMPATNVPLITANGDLYLEARRLAQIANAVGRSNDAIKYNALADRIQVAFNATFFDPTANVYHTALNVGYRPTSNLVPLAYGLVPAGHEQAVYDNLVADIHAHGDHLNTGAIGTKLLLPVLTEHGDVDLAYTVATQTTYPSWGYWLTQGATTSWETWSHTDPSQSEDHSFLGTFEDWLYQYLAGIQPAAPGYAEVRIKPVTPAGLDFAAATVGTPRGRLSSSWRRVGGGLLMEVEIPGDTPAEVFVPASGAGEVRVAGGQARLLRQEGGYGLYEVDPGKHDQHVTFFVQPGKH